jgi:hypothetical protein
MNQFTQLNLSGKQEPKPAGQAPKSEPQHPASSPKTNNNNSHKPKTLTIVGSAVAFALMGVALLETSGCSKATKTAISTPTPQPSVQATMPTPAPVTTPEPVVKKPVKKAARAKIPTAIYNNKDYNVSFRYPKYDSLKQGDDAKMEWTGIGPVPMNFSQPGGTTLSAVELPNGLYPGTDFASAFFNVSVDPKSTAEQCEQFASTSASSDATANASSDASSSADKPAKPSKVKIGKTEFSEMETLAGDSKQADAKYYHVFQNGNCYEFTLGMQTATQAANDASTNDTNADSAKNDKSDDVTPVNRSQVFRKLEWILSTVKITPQEAPEVASGTTTTASTPAVAPETTAVKVIDDRQ